MLSSLAVSEVQRDLVDVTRRLLAERAPIAAARAVAEGGDHPSAWPAAVDVGLPGLTVPAEHGGSGLGLPDALLVLEEAGAVLWPEPLAASLVAGLVVTDPVTLRRIAAGDRVALAAGHGDEIAADANLTGTIRYVPGAAEADLLLVAAGGDLHAVVDWRSDPVSGLDRTRRIAHVAVDAPAHPVGPAAGAGDLLLVALGAELVGVGRRALADAVAHAAGRHQFGRPVGSFQAVKHLLAHALTAVEGARSLVRLAGAAPDDDLPRQASAVKVAAAEAACRATADALQVQGGMGYTWEADAHLLFGRAWAARALYGDLDAHRRRVLDRWRS